MFLVQMAIVLGQHPQDSNGQTHLSAAMQEMLIIEGLPRKRKQEKVRGAKFPHGVTCLPSVGMFRGTIAENSGSLVIGS